MPRIPPNTNIAPGNEDTSPANASETMELLFSVMGQSPEIMQQTRKLLEVTMRGGHVAPKLKELLAVRVSQVNHCFY